MTRKLTHFLAQILAFVLLPSSQSSGKLFFCLNLQNIEVLLTNLRHFTTLSTFSFSLSPDHYNWIIQETFSHQTSHH